MIIKIKLNDTLTPPETTINLTILFTSANENYNNMVFLVTGTLRYQRTGLTTYVYRNGAYDKPECQYIEIDTTQHAFNEFITKMKDNIASVELEAGTYKWINNPNIDGVNISSDVFSFNCNDVTYSYIEVSQVRASPVELTYAITYAPSSGQSTRVYTLSSWTLANENYKTIVLDTNQYVSYDFYNYAILGNQLVKQGGGTNNLKFGTETPSKLYMGETEVTKVYMGEVLVYEK